MEIKAVADAKKIQLPDNIIEKTITTCASDRIRQFGFVGRLGGFYFSQREVIAIKYLASQGLLIDVENHLRVGVEDQDALGLGGRRRTRVQPRAEVRRRRHRRSADARGLGWP